ncbi:hypothetical protein A2524_03235 [Candidatus Wolfebacteria bacterium RIFOXYD12_FULL_48_21]|uniref:Uncharacterized protein n=1 Tax=Candidatus Wolfebacteria bacterium RIFOXYD1_FULL_48_65 TaxID=1802561 RepID=A0A1F8E3T5_9BACT|nr:MAG: hypothetical protein A2524_03235 [Candidatus Wolfebacteria bacterium RIFOXYD12_FULL_48_21]OGM95496.1 MAG: hypothetical protein A2610_03275 [Candidatus Wolfebacteria bacterium RIFOXYD1_FULL_48_65]OGM97839.1 MAG: hypothetical protein A2532_04670 [Candidatus Wolfebacteria bacterium RIFOXYD2_FULL_48_11]
MIAGEYARDTKNTPPNWVEIVHGCTVIKFIRQGKEVHASSRYSLKECRGRTSTYLPPAEFEECRRMACSILHPYCRQIRARPHWMDEIDD